MKKILRIICVTFILLLTPIAAHASCNILIDGTELICTTAQGDVISPFIENGTTYVPVRSIAEAFGVSVSWEQETKTVYLGKKGGTPELGDNINIYYNGEPYTCFDANLSPVYPILKDSATYLPIRGIGSLLGKKVSWDNVTQTAVLTTPPTKDAVSYLSNAVINTEKMTALSQDLSFAGQVFFNDALVSEIKKHTETTEYIPSEFSLSAILPEDYTQTVSYLGDGSFFIYCDSSKFISAPFTRKALVNASTETVFSPLYITLTTRGGYVKTISLFAGADITFNGLIFDEGFNIYSLITYPENFSFPKIPYPNSTQGEESVFGKDVLDAQAIEKLVNKFVSGGLEKAPGKLLDLLYDADYLKLYAKKTENQQKVTRNNIYKSLNTLFKNATGNYEITSMVYLKDPQSFTHSPEEVSKITLLTECEKGSEVWTEEMEITLVKLFGQWYLAPSVIENLM